MTVGSCIDRVDDPTRLVHLPKIVPAYCIGMPDTLALERWLGEGTFGPRGSAFDKAFNEYHVHTISQALDLYREQQRIDGLPGPRPGHAGALRTGSGQWQEVLGAENISRIGRDSGEIYHPLTREFGEPAYDCIEPSAMSEQQEMSSPLLSRHVRLTELSRETIQSVFTDAPDNEAPIGGVKVIGKSVLLAARPSGTEDIDKIDVESFLGTDYPRGPLEKTRRMVSKALAASPQQPGIPSEPTRKEQP